MGFFAPALNGLKLLRFSVFSSTVTVGYHFLLLSACIGQPKQQYTTETTKHSILLKIRINRLKASVQEEANEQSKSVPVHRLLDIYFYCFLAYYVDCG